MENVDEQLKKNIRSILNTVSEETVNGIIHALKHAGLESLSDLQYVQEDDLILVLKPIQRRKLVKAWSQQGENGNNLDDISVASESSYTSVTQSTNLTSEPAFIPPPYRPSYIPPLEISNEYPLEHYPWKKKHRVALMQIYAKYKTELSSCPAVDQERVWLKIAEEFQYRTSLNFGKLECRNKIADLRCKYLKIKGQTVVNKKERSFLRDATNAFEDAEISVVQNNSPLPEISCGTNKLIKLLEIYAKHKKEFTDPAVKEKTVWKKIADEFSKLSPVNYNGSQCCSKINELRHDYEHKNIYEGNSSSAMLLDKARECFETTESSKSLPTEPLLNCRNLKFSFYLLEVYAKYKAEFASPDIETQEIWKKITTELRERYLFDCGETFCQFKLFQLKCKYEDIKRGKKKKENNFRFFMEAQKAFEDSDTFNFEMDKVENKIDKYVPPHLRITENKLDEAIISSKIIDSRNKVKVSNLSDEVGALFDLQELFTPFGEITHFYTVKNELDESKCFAYVTFQRKEDAARAIVAVDGIELNNSKLKVEWAEFSQTDEIS